MESGSALVARLRAAGVEQGASPLGAWRRLREREGVQATVLDLYELTASPRGLQAHDLPLEEREALARAVMPIVWPGFTVTEGRRRGEPVEIIEYDPDWPRKYEQWRERLQAALGEVARRIEHVGSTSVPGLPAKPTVDIQSASQIWRMKRATCPR